MPQGVKVQVLSRPPERNPQIGDFLNFGDVVELVDTLASGASESNLVKVQVLSSPPKLAF